MLKKYLQFIRFLIQAFFMVGIFLPFLPFADNVGRMIFLSVVFLGVFFCGFICPFGAIQDWLGWMAQKLRIPRFKVPPYIQVYLQCSRYFFYALSTIGITFFFLSARFEFNHGVFLGAFEWITAGTIGVFLLLAIFTDRPFCNYFCPKGASLGLLSVMRLISISREESKCVHCHLCDKACPMNIMVEQSDFVRHPNCINCMKCICACPQDCLRFKLLTIKQQKGKTK